MGSTRLPLDGMHLETPGPTAATPVTACGGFLGQVWQGAAPAPGFDNLPEGGVRHSTAGPLTAAAWGGADDAAGWLHDRGLSIGFHGEVCNADVVALALDLAPSAPLLQVLQAGWERWGEALFGRLDGVFAMAVYQPGRLTLYRDPSGLAGLYLYNAGGWHVSFATDLSLLLLLPGTERRLSRRSLHEFLRFLQITAPHAFFEHVTALKPGQVHIWPSAPARPQAAKRAPDEPFAATFDAAVDELDAHLRRSVRTRLAETVAPAAFLSGGVDSALLCALAATCQPHTTAITVGFDLAAYDESLTAGRISEHLGLRHEVLRFSHAAYLRAFDRFSICAEQPMADPASLATLLAFQHCKDHYDVVIDGTGADEAVGIMPPRHIRVAINSSRFLPDPIRHGMAWVTRRVPELGGFTPILDFEHPAETMIPWKGFSRAEIAGLCGEVVSFSHTHFYDIYAREQRSGHFALYSALIDAVPCERITQAMRISGARIRFPFCEKGTDAFLRTLAMGYRYQPNEPKRILRGLLERCVPVAIWGGPKHGFNFPLDDFLSQDDFAIVRRHLDASRWRTLGVLSPEGVQGYASRYIGGDLGLTLRIWALVVLSGWLEHHVCLR